jgi:hypothetical protein
MLKKLEMEMFDNEDFDWQFIELFKKKRKKNEAAAVFSAVHNEDT